MDKQYQDIHIYNNKKHDTRVIREVTINHITFNSDCVIIEYKQYDIKVVLEIPKPHYEITID